MSGCDVGHPGCRRAEVEAGEPPVEFRGRLGEFDAQFAGRRDLLGVDAIVGDGHGVSAAQQGAHRGGPGDREAMDQHVHVS